MKQYYIHPADLHILFNLVNSSESFKQSETFTPICLPKFDATGFLHAYVSYISDEACLLLVTAERDSFFELSEAKKNIASDLEKQEAFDWMKEASTQARPEPSLSGAANLQHYMYKTKTAGQFISSSYRSDVQNPGRIEKLYRIIQSKMAQQSAKLYFYSGALDIIVGWSTQAFELYAAFDVTATKAEVMEDLNRLLKYFTREKNFLFIQNAHTF